MINTAIVGLGCHKLRLAQSLQALLRDLGVHAVVLCTPHSMHTDQVIGAAQGGKHVFCGKPFTLASLALPQTGAVAIGLLSNMLDSLRQGLVRNRIVLQTSRTAAG
jgi:hypothetical protein